MSLKRTHAFAILLAVLFAGILAGCAALSGPETVQVTVVVTEAGAEEAPPAMTPTPAGLPPKASFSPTIKETRRLTAEWPSAMRKGDADLIRVTLEMDENGEVTPTVEIEGHEIGGSTVIIPDLYDTHRVKATAQLNLAGISFSPATQTEKTLLRGESVTFYWSANPNTEGDYLGTISFQLSFIPKDGGQETQISLSEQIFKIHVKTLFGMDGRAARIVGWVFSLLGAIFSFDDIIKFLKKQFGAKNTDPA